MERTNLQLLPPAESTRQLHRPSVVALIPTAAGEQKFLTGWSYRKWIFSNLTITSNSLPAARVGVRYLFRFTARGGKPPYSWMVETCQFSGLPKGLYFIRTGPNAGTITGIPRVTGSFWVPVIVRDKVGHSAFTILNKLQVTS